VRANSNWLPPNDKVENIISNKFVEEEKLDAQINN
jgi:hypothetical protein